MHTQISVALHMLCVGVLFSLEAIENGAASRSQITPEQFIRITHSIIAMARRSAGRI